MRRRECISLQQHRSCMAARRASAAVGAVHGGALRIATLADVSHGLAIKYRSADN
jgi:hypothetical protein